MPSVFVSYAREDRDRVLPLAEALERQGWTVWWDRRIPPGRTFDQVIEEQLDAADVVVVVWTASAVSSDWVKTEAAEGRDRGILIPVLMTQVRIPLEFRRIQFADLTDWDPAHPHPGLDELIAAVAVLVEEPPVAGTFSRRFELSAPADDSSERGLPGSTATSHVEGQPVPSPLVFICHASEDRNDVERIADGLRAAGIKVWADEEDIRGSESWADAVAGVIHDADYVVIVQSVAMKRLETLASFVNREIHKALERQLLFPRSYRFVIPTSLDGAEHRSAELELFPDIDVSRQAGTDDLVRTILYSWLRRHPKRSADD